MTGEGTPVLRTQVGGQWGLSDRTLATVREILGRYPEIERAVLYGSRAMGNYREGSDIDLTLVGAAVTQATRGHVWNDLDDSDIPYLVDVSVLRDISNPSLVDHIQRVGVVLYERPQPPAETL